MGGHNISAPSFVANAHNELYTHVYGKSSFLKNAKANLGKAAAFWAFTITILT